MTIDKQLAEITEADLNGLITSLVKEGKDIEFKRELNWSTPEAKRKFLRGVASFANTQGGHIIFGMEAKDGVAQSLHALADFNEDSDTIRLRDFIRAHIEPKVYGVEFRAVSLSGGGHALVLWIPRGWAGPHMVTLDNDNRFYCRQGNGTALMDVGEVRTAFAVAESLPEKVRRLRLDRLSAIASGDMPRPLSNPEALVLHFIPVKSLDPLYECDLESFAALARTRREYLITTFEDGGQSAIEFDFDSVIKAYASNERCFGYTRFFRTGVLEIVDSLRLEVLSTEGNAFFANGYEQLLFDSFPKWLETLRVARLEPPVLVALSFIGMAGRFPYLDGWKYKGSARPHPIRHDPLLIRPKLIDSLNATTGEAMIPIFNQVWQSCGRSKSVNFDASGNWVGE